MARRNSDSSPPGPLFAVPSVGETRTTQAGDAAGIGPASTAKEQTRRRPAVRKRTGPTRAPEEAQFLSGDRHVCGVDEAGRGPLAGPVVAAAVILDPDMPPPEGLDDSKVLTAGDRETLFAAILADAHVAVGTASAAEIDALNIRQATLLAMRRAVRGLPIAPCHALIDGRDLPPSLSCPGSALVGGDALSVSIAAASIVAKVTRDAIMRRADIRHPGYGFARHMGYPTADHRRAIEALGPCPLHRMSFRPLRRD